jgi:micrococcal nuclease
MRRLGSTALLLAALAGAATTTSPVTPTTADVRPAASARPAVAGPVLAAGRVTYIADGDTVHVTPPGRERIKVRVLGIDTPETRDPRVGVECWGPEATAFATDTLSGRHVTLVGDPTQAAVDTYGRTLAHVVLDDGANYSVLAAAAGVARPYVYDGTPVLEHPAITAAADGARAAGRGLWGACPV